MSEPYFRCTLHRCVLPVRVCLSRQTEGPGPWKFTGGAMSDSYNACKICDQGARVKSGKYRRVKMPVAVSVKTAAQNRLEARHGVLNRN